MPQIEAYEQQLASNEARLQAMGVRVAQRALTEAEKGEAKKDARVPADDRFAPPPPAPTVGDASASSRPERSPRKAKSPSAASKSDPAAEPVAPAPTASKPRPTAGGSGRAAGYDAPAPAGVSADERDNNDEGNRCSELCELASSTCELEAKICDLAARHVQEPRYGVVCQRAGEDCRLAADACTLCSP